MAFIAQWLDTDVQRPFYSVANVVLLSQHEKRRTGTALNKTGAADWYQATVHYWYCHDITKSTRTYSVNWLVSQDFAAGLCFVAFVVFGTSHFTHALYGYFSSVGASLSVQIKQPGGKITLLQWCHNKRDGVRNDQRLRCLLNRLFRHRSKKTSTLRVTGLCEGNPSVTGGPPLQRAGNVENICIWWRHHNNKTNHNNNLCFSYGTHD